jgi:hypothetical protein
MLLLVVYESCPPQVLEPHGRRVIELLCWVDADFAPLQSSWSGVGCDHTSIARRTILGLIIVENGGCFHSYGVAGSSCGELRENIEVK